MNVFNTKTKKYYYTFITVEAYNAVKEWMDFRASFGEQIMGESWVMRDLWQIKSQRFGNYLGLARNPKQLSSAGIRMLINDAWKIQGVRGALQKGKKRYDFKSLHGFRKFFESQCQKVMKSINVSFLMSHDIGIAQHYYRPTEDDMLNDYLEASDLLTINEENRLQKKVKELTDKGKDNEYVIKGRLEEKDKQIEQLIHKQDKFEQLIQSLIDSGQLRPRII